MGRTLDHDGAAEAEKVSEDTDKDRVEWSRQPQAEVEDEENLNELAKFGRAGISS